MTKFRSTMKRLSLLTLVVFISCASAFAQSKTVTGVVKDTSGDAVIGASVVVKGTTTGTVTDIDGNFSVNVPASGKTLVFSYVGMKNKEVAITGSVVNVTLEEDVSVLDEVVVIGYGTVKRRDLTGSVSSVGEKTLKDIPVTTAAEAITGKLAGVQVTTTEGSPDAEIKIRVRGGGSITQSNDPLYIVDGFPVNSISDIAPTDIASIDVLKDASSTAIYGSRGANGVIIVTTKSAKEGKLTINYNGYGGFKNVTKTLDVMNPYEFASLQYEQAVLQNKVSNNYEPYFGVYEDINLYKDMKGTDWQDVIFGRTGTTWNHNISLNGGSKVASFNATYGHIDDKAVMLGSSYSRDNLNLKVNANPIDWMKLNFTTRYSVTTVEGAGANDVTGTEKSTSDSRVKNAVIYTPIPLKNLTTPDDDPTSIGNLYPPTQQVADNDRFRKTHLLNINGGISIDLMKNLVFRTELGIDQMFREDNRYYGTSTYYVNGGGGSDNLGHPAIQLREYKSNTFRNTNTLTYNFDYAKDHHFNVMIGQEIIETNYQQKTSIVDNFPDFFDSEMAWSFSTQGRATSTENYYSPDDKLASFFGRLNYDYLNRYLFTVTFRADGSSKFGPGNKWGYFPSFAAAWRINDEAFLKDIDWLANLKLRASYGEAGNNNISALSYMQTYASSSTTYSPYTSSYWAIKKDDDGNTAMANPDLKWETTITRNVGLDFGFWGGRLSGTLDLYWNTTEDLLLKYLTTGSGYTYQLRNIGETSNKGVELSLNASLIEKKDFRLDFNFNISANKNKIESLGGMDNFTYSSGWTKAAYGTPDYIIEVDKPVGQMYGYVLDGNGMYSVDDFKWNGTKWVMNDDVYKPVVGDDGVTRYVDANGNVFVDNSNLCGSSWGPGALKLKDLNGDGKISSDELDRKVIGNANPKHTGGFGLSAVYKGIDLTVNFNWVYGNDILNANKIEFSNTANYNARNMLSEFDSNHRFTHIDANGQRVTDPVQLAAMNANATVWSPINDASYSYSLHSGMVEDGSFLRLNNLTVGYSLPKAWLSKIYMQQIRIYATAYNLYTWTNYSGYDPEVDSRRSSALTPGVDYSAYPKSRSFNFGVNLTF